MTLKQKIKCWFGIHDFEIIKENNKPKEIGVISKDNPYANLGQMQVCWLRKCRHCNLIEASWLRNSEPHNGWHQVIEFYDKEKIVDLSGFGEGALPALIEKGTPVIENLGYDSEYV